MPPPSRPNRPETRPTAQRNASIDSAVSSLSSNASQSYTRSNTSHSYKSSQDANAAQNPPDMHSLLIAAGSPEAALLALWKDKQSASNHNSQLWRLVEKQRAMILCLNKDLERALKDKERYRKKLREHLQQAPPLPSAPRRANTAESAVERDQTPSSAPSDAKEHHPKPGPSADHHTNSPLAQPATVTQLIPESQLAQSPAHSSEAQSDVQSSAVNSPTDYSVKPLSVSTKVLGLDAVVAEHAATVEAKTRPSDAAEPKTEPGLSASPGRLNPPELALIQPTPIIGGNGFDLLPEKAATPLRKAPPAPLNLAKSQKESAQPLQHAVEEPFETEGDDTLAAEEVPVFVDRGRRKTREDDDRAREVLFLQEEEARSKSKQMTSDPQDGEKPPSTPSLSPRPVHPTQVGLPASPRHPPAAGSLNAVLSPTNSDGSMVAQRSVGSPPVMSPGLPTSPRPGDRPIGSPQPRNPRQTFASPPVSPRNAPPAAPPQPLRSPQHQFPAPPASPPAVPSPRQAVHVQSSRQDSGSSGFLRAPQAEAEQNASGLADPEHVYRGLVTDQYPGLLLPPNALPSIDIKVFSSRLRPSRMSFLVAKPQEEDPVFQLGIYARADGKQLWRVEKTIMALPALDEELKSLCDFHGKLPDRSLFSGHAPAKIDARRAALNHFFSSILETSMGEKAAQVVCGFFSTDVIGAQNDDASALESPSATATPQPKGKQRKEGYLTKRV